MPNRASDLDWAAPYGPETDAGPTAPGLRRATVVRSAIDVADADGLDAVSIRRVASELGVRPMSLYTHIASKDDLVALMLDEMSGRLLVPEPLPDDWREALRQIARRARDEYVAHPWMVQALGRGTRVGPNILRRGEQSAAAVAGLDLDPADAWVALSIVHEWTLGHALHVATLRQDSQLEVRLRDADAERFPRMTRVFGEGRVRSADGAFDTALEAVLDGIERRFL